MKLLLFMCIAIICLNYVVDCAKILAIFHCPVFSHQILAEKLLRPLAEKGHELTVVWHQPLKDPPKTWREFILEEKELDGKNFYNFVRMSGYEKEIVTNDIGLFLVNNFFDDLAMKKLLNLNETFDLIIFEKFMNEALLGFSHYFKAPYVLLSTIGHSRWLTDITGNPGSPAYVPDFYLGHSQGMNLWERLDNTIFYCFTKLYRHLIILPKHRELLKTNFPESPDLEDLYYNASLILLNCHFSVKYALPSVPNIIEIGGYHVSPPKSLPKDVQEFMDSATHGVIYFSLGSGVKSKDMPVASRDAILKTFSKLKQKVIWKWEDEETFNKPSNVKLGKWFPQQDILAHPNLKLFITHGGLLSIIESVYHGVPLLAVPIFAEQLMNAVEIEQLGYGRKILFADIPGDSFGSLINEILTNDKYKKEIKLRSKILNDQEIKPIDRAIFWIEYVIRYKGAPHLKSVTLKLNWYQYLLLDVTFIILLTLVIVVLILYVCIKKILKKNHNKVKAE